VPGVGQQRSRADGQADHHLQGHDPDVQPDGEPIAPPCHLAVAVMIVRAMRMMMAVGSVNVGMRHRASLPNARWHGNGAEELAALDQHQRLLK
jgi:hypothetical protein